MALDPRIALAGIQPQFSLFDLGATMARGQQLQREQLALTEEQRSQAAAAQTRQAFAQQYGGGPPAGLAGAMPPWNGAGEAPLPPLAAQEAAASHQALYGTPPPSASSPAAGVPSGSPPGLTGLSGQMGGGGQAPADRQGQSRAFVNKLYTIDPKAAMAYEQHLTATTKAQSDAQDAQMKANVARVEFLGRVADGVLESESPQQAWEVARAMLREQGMPESQLPAVYDPSYVKQLSGMARDAKDKYNAGMLRVAQAKEQRERTEAGASIPNYGLGQEANAVMHEMFGAQLPPGSAPTPAMTQRVNAELVRREREADAATQQGRVEVAAATGSSQIVQTPQGYMRVNPRTGAVEQVQGPTGALQPKPTEAEHRAQSLGERARRAHETATALEEQGVWPGYYEKAAQKLPFGQSALSADQQRYQQSLLEFTQALLRKESGAAVTQSEYEATAKTYFPQPGDKPAVLKQKQQARAAVIQNMQEEAGAARPPRSQAGPPKPLPRTVEDLDREIADIERQLQGQ